MSAAEQVVAALVTGRRMTEREAVALVREEANRLDATHVGLMATWGATTLMRQHAADIDGHPEAGAA